MDLQDCINVVEKLLRQNNREHKDSHAQLLYERGYLTGFLARVLMTDPRLRIDVIEMLKKK